MRWGTGTPADRLHCTSSGKETVPPCTSETPLEVCAAEHTLEKEEEPPSDSCTHSENEEEPFSDSCTHSAQNEQAVAHTLKKKRNFLQTAAHTLEKKRNLFHSYTL